MNCAEIRRRFVEYYENLGFRFLPRAPMLHPSIPMSFVMSAGLVQVETSLAHAKNRTGNKFVLVQDCFRHFDLDAVGTDAIHLSLFEMPGAFMFGKDGRQSTIHQMWALATEVMQIDPQRIWVSYFRGDTVADQELPHDKQTYQTWRQLGIPENRLVALGRKHNYWIQGGGIENEVSPLKKSGMNTELFYDLGIEKACGATCQPGCRCGRFVEFSNSLFISHNFNPQTSTLIPLDETFTETVIGTERVAMILQNVPSVFDTMDYHPVVNTIHQFVTHTDLPLSLVRESERVIADHLRALYVLIADGAPPPGKNGRERLIKLLIRQVLTRQLVLGITVQGFLSQLIHSILAALSNGNGHQPSGVIEKKIIAYFETESQRFQKSIERGKREMERMLVNNQGQTLYSVQIVTLEKKWGLPHLLTSSILSKKGLSYSQTGYKEALEG